MASPELLAEVLKARRKGLDDPAIAARCLKLGWATEDVNGALAAATLRMSGAVGHDAPLYRKPGAKGIPVWVYLLAGIVLLFASAISYLLFVPGSLATIHATWAKVFYIDSEDF